jgi:hypothetical protein
MPAPPGCLSPYRVLDLTDARAGLGPMVLAGLGADVIKVEPPAAATRAAPSRSSRACRPRSRACASTRSIAASAAWCSISRARAARRLPGAGRERRLRDRERGTRAMDARGLGFTALRESRRDLVYVAISPFGQTGPYAHHLATDLTLSAMGGAMSLMGEPDRRPVRVTVPQSWHHAAVEGALAALVAHQRALASGEAQFVDVSVQAAMFWTGLNAMIAHAIHGTNIERNGTWLQLSTLVTPLVYPCADGEVTLVATTATLLPLIPWMSRRAWSTSGGPRSRTGAPTSRACSTGAELAIRCPRCASRSRRSRASTPRPICSRAASRAA